jgi:hypothetical protein
LGLCAFGLVPSHSSTLDTRKSFDQTKQVGFWSLLCTLVGHRFWVVVGLGLDGFAARTWRVLM